MSTLGQNPAMTETRTEHCAQPITKAHVTIAIQRANTKQPQAGTAEMGSWIRKKCATGDMT